tara:strand:- start:26776 stop:27459 length:684 start_codon:yes stop_codon:yes gene_type:complete
MKTAFVPLAFLIGLMSSICLSSAYSQVVVYNIDFDKVGPSANYRSYDRGFLVMPLDGGDVDFIFQFQVGSTRYFVEASEFGTYYITTEDDEREGVVANATTSNTPINFFMAIGDLNTTVRATVTTTDETSNVTTATKVSQKVPNKLEGYILTADPSGAGVFDANSGAAGASEMTATLDAVRTNTANLQQLTIAETVASLVESLELAGWQELIVSEEGAEDDAVTTGG